VLEKPGKRNLHRRRLDNVLPEDIEKIGERGRNRTFNLLIKSQLLCQLSYAPFSCGEIEEGTSTEDRNASLSQAVFPLSGISALGPPGGNYAPIVAHTIQEYQPICSEMAEGEGFEPPIPFRV
jgi:hypothetical protein